MASYLYGLYGKYRPRMCTTKKHSTTNVEHPRTDSERGGIEEIGGNDMKSARIYTNDLNRLIGVYHSCCDTEEQARLAWNTRAAVREET